MKKAIISKRFDTENAELVGCFYHSIFGDPAGYSERLYKSPDGNYFLLSAGGLSVYPGEHIRPISAANAHKWIEMHMLQKT